MMLAAAKMFHVIGVVLWIGGVAMVTTVILPTVRKFRSAEERIQFFEMVEHRFAWQARFTTLLTGISGFYMVSLMNGWGRYEMVPQFWWMHAMTLVWVIFTVVLFVLEPLVLRKKVIRMASKDSEKTFSRIQRMHWVLLTLSLLTVAGAMAGSHGWYWL